MTLIVNRQTDIRPIRENELVICKDCSLYRRLLDAAGEKSFKIIWMDSLTYKEELVEWCNMVMHRDECNMHTPIPTILAWLTALLPRMV